MSKGENEAEVLRLPSSPKGEIVGIMAKVLSLMATHSGDRSQQQRLMIRYQILKKIRGT